MANHLFASNQGADHLGLNKPDETFYALKEGADYGWGSCYQSNGKIYLDKTPPNNLKKPTDRLKSCAVVPVSYAYFPAHSSVMGFDYFDDEDADASIKDAFLVSLHGSTNKNLGKGYKIVVMRKGEKLQNFITGFLQGKTVHGRPCDILKLSANSFLFTDDHTGIIYHVRKKGTTARIDNTEETPPTANESASASNVNSQNETPREENSKSCWSAIGAILLAISLRLFF